METNNETPNKKRLGRGLSSLFSENQEQKIDYSTPKKEVRAQTEVPVKAAPAIEPENRIWHIAVDKLVPGVYQPRRKFDKESLQELATSIKENGLLQPITVRKRPSGGFEIIAGERRWRAAQIAGFHEIPALVKDIADRDALQLAIIENVQREDLDPIEEADGYQSLMTEFGYSQQQVSEKVGKERSSVANALRLLGLPHEIKEMVVEKLLSVGHAKALLTLTDKSMQIQLAKTSIAKTLSVRALEAEIKNKLAVPSKAKSNIELDVAGKLANELADQIQKKMGTKTEIKYQAGKGQVVLHFYSDEQLNQIYEKLNT